MGAARQLLARSAGTIQTGHGPANRALAAIFLASSSHRTVDGLVLAGGCGSIQDIDRFVEGVLGIPTAAANPFVNMHLAPRVKPQSLNNDAPALMTACGLALRSLD